MPISRAFGPVALLCLALFMGFVGSARAYVWYPQNASVSDTSINSWLKLTQTGGSGGAIWSISCRPSLAGTTPGNSPNLQLGIGISQCNMAGMAGTATDSIAQVYLTAQKPTFDSYKGWQTGGGYAFIGDPSGGPSFVLKFKNIFYNCTVTIGSAGTPEGFVIYPNFYSSPQPARLDIKPIEIPVDVSGTAYNGTPCSPVNGKWTIETLHAAISPYLEIR